MKLLILEQDEITKFLNHRFLSNSFEVLQSSSIQEFCEAAKSHTPDIVIIEINYLGQYMAGLEILEKVTPCIGDPKCLKIATTFALRPNDHGRIIQAGFDEIIEHPLTVESIIKLVDRQNTKPIRII